jgi:hypothetical protein
MPNENFALAYLAVGLLIAAILVVLGICRIVKLTKLQHAQFERAMYNEDKRLKNDAIITRLNRNADWRG